MVAINSRVLGDINRFLKKLDIEAANPEHVKAGKILNNIMDGKPVARQVSILGEQGEELASIHYPLTGRNIQIYPKGPIGNNYHTFLEISPQKNGEVATSFANNMETAINLGKLNEFDRFQFSDVLASIGNSARQFVDIIKGKMTS